MIQYALHFHFRKQCAAVSLPFERTLLGKFIQLNLHLEQCGNHFRNGFNENHGVSAHLNRINFC